ncbi:mitochondrial nucleoid-associated protein 1 [Pelodytes ibericus]
MNNASYPLPLETCPYCGKSFKRLKSHLPHCKMAIPRKDKETATHGTPMLKPKFIGKKTKMEQGSNGITENESKSRKSKNLLQDDNGITTIHTAITNIRKTNTENTGTHKSKTRLHGSIDTKSQNVPPCLVLDSHNLHQPADLISSNHSKTLDKHISRDMITQMLSVAGVKDTVLGNQNTNGLHVLASCALDRQVIPCGSIPEGKSLVDRKTVLWNQMQNNRTSEFQTVGADQTEYSPLIIHEGLTAEIKWERGDIQTAAKTLVWDHIKTSLCEKSAYQNWIEKGMLLSCNSKHSQVSTDLPYINAQESFHNQMLGCTSDTPFLHQSEIHSAVKYSAKSLEKIKQSVESNLKVGLDSVSNHKAVTSQPFSDVAPSSNLGMQWIPELYPNVINVHTGREKGLDTQRKEIKTKIATETQHDVHLQSKRLMDVRLGQLSSWLYIQHFSIKSLKETTQNAWGRYYKKYINVRKGGVGGLTMLLAGYCILSYVWNYKHIQQDRRRRYH